MKKNNIIFLFATLPLLMSATPSTKHYSNIAGKTYSDEIKEVIIDSSKNYSGTSNGDSGKNVAMNVTVDYELFKMGKNMMYAGETPTVYSLLYRVHVDLKETYQYKSGWWIFAKSYTAMPFLSEISTTLNLSGFSGNIINNSPSIESNGSYNVREEGLDFDTTGGSLDTYRGTYYFNPVHYFNPSFIETNNDIFFTRKNESTFSDTYTLSTNAYYDTNLLHSYTADTDVYFFGGVSFTSDSLPSNIELSVDVKCGGTQNNELKCNYLTTGSSSNQLYSYEINNLIKNGHKGYLIQRNYDNIITVSDKIKLF